MTLQVPPVPGEPVPWSRDSEDEWTPHHPYRRWSIPKRPDFVTLINYINLLHLFSTLIYYVRFPDCIIRYYQE